VRVIPPAPQLEVPRQPPGREPDGLQRPAKAPDHEPDTGQAPIQRRGREPDTPAPRS
jgi:hypothetical protein